MRTLPCCHLFHRALGAAALGVWLTQALAGELAPSAAARVITRVAEIRALSRADAGRALAVKICGVVTWRSTTANGDFVVDDGDQGIYVAHLATIKTVVMNHGKPPQTATEVGARVEIDGVTNPGGYAPVIVPTLIRRIGSGPLPAARHLPLERLISGNDDSQRIEVEGVVQEVADPDEAGITTIHLMVDGHRFRVNFEHGREIVADALVDARVRVTGILTPMLNLRSEVASCNMTMTTIGAGDLQIVKPPPADAFLAPHVELDRLLPFSPDREPFHRRVTKGVIIFAQPGHFFFLQQGNTGARVESSAANVTVGELVEVAGFIETTHTLASIGGGMVRRLGHGTLPAPRAVAVKQLLNPIPRYGAGQPDSDDYSGRLVQLHGKLLKIERDEKNRLRALLIESEEHIFSALPSGTGREWTVPTAGWVEGAELALSGVCELDFAEVSQKRDTPVIITGFKLWLRTPQDVQVRVLPSWWTPARLQLALVWAGVIIAVGVAWISLLRWLLRRRTQRLEQVMRGHRDVELEFASAQRERLRLAVDLHDGIKQNLAAATFRVDAAAGSLPDSPVAAAAHLETAHSTLLRTQTELEECLWGLHAVAEGPPDFVHLLHHVTASNEHWPKGAVHIASEGTPRYLPRDVAGSLLLLVQEAGGNAFRHGRATRIAITVNFGAETFDLRVVDDGAGFDPRAAPASRAGHFGIDGMKQRMRWLGGSLHLARHPAGMEIHARLPWSVLRDLDQPEPLTTGDTPHRASITTS